MNWTLRALCLAALIAGSPAAAAPFRLITTDLTPSSSRTR